MKLIRGYTYTEAEAVVPYIGTWIETYHCILLIHNMLVVPYIGTWIETTNLLYIIENHRVVPYIGTWIET